MNPVHHMIAQDLVEELVELGNAERGDGEVRLLWVVENIESRASYG